MVPNSHTLLTTLALASLLGLAPPLTAQESGTIRGKVEESGSRKPLSDARVSIDGTPVGAVTDAAGAYRITGVAPGSHTLRVILLGYKPTQSAVTLAPGQPATADFTMTQVAINLNTMVVTGTPGATSKRALGNSVVQIDAATAVKQAPINNVSELLQARAPGLAVIGNGGMVGTSGSIQIRGIHSITGSNRPAVYIDGVRVYSGYTGNFSNNYAFGGVQVLGGQNADALSMIDPQDIERVEIVEGPAAATLYGAEAANGVINIITKKGRAGQQRLQWDAKVSRGMNEWGQAPTRNYTACTTVWSPPASLGTPIPRQSQHLKLNNASTPMAWPGCQGLAAGSVINYSGLADNPFGLRHGSADQYHLAVRGGGDGYSFYVSGDNNVEGGVFRNNDTQRNNGRGNFSFFPTKTVNFAVQIGYDRSHTRFAQGDNGGTGLVISNDFWAPGYDYKDAFQLTQDQYLRRQGFAWNPPDVANEWDNQLWGDRFVLSNTLNYQPFSWFRNRLIAGMDNNNESARNYLAPLSSWSKDGSLYTQEPRHTTYTVDYAGTIENDLPRQLVSSLSFGTQYLGKQYKNLIGTGIGFASSFNRLVGQAAQTTSNEAEIDQASLGLFGQEQLAWRDRLYVTGGLRVDNNSVFGANIQHIYYPKISASYVISDEPFFHLPQVSQLKLRMAYGGAGRAPGAFDAARTYTALVGTQQNGASAAGIKLGAFGNPNLKPERGTEFEGGFDASFFNDRAGLTLTYYNQQTHDAIMAVPLSPSSGFTGSELKNLGNISNRGLEVELNGTPVQRRALTWNSSLTLSTNHNRLVSFGYKQPPIQIGFYGLPQQYHPGYPIGGYWAKRYARNPDGSYATNAKGLFYTEDTASYIGPVAPTRQLAFGNTITLFGNLDLFGLLDYKSGNYQYDYQDLSRCSGERCKLVATDEATMDNPAASQAAKDAALQELKVYTYLGGVPFYDRKINFIQKADFVRLRDVSVTYRVPPRFTQQFGSQQMSLSLAAYNMFLWKPYYKGADPEVNFYGQDPILKIDSWTAPNLRRVVGSVTVSF